MVAKNQKESETIQEIIKAFRISTLPGYADPVGNIAGIGSTQTGAGGTERKKGAG